MDEERHTTEETLKARTEKIWGATNRTIHKAGFKAQVYRMLVQHRLEIGALQRRVNHLHQDLGMRIDALYSRQASDIMNQAEVRELLGQIDEVKTQMALLEHDIEELRHAPPEGEDKTPPPESDQPH